MLDDLALCISSVDWTDAKLPAFKQKMEDWTHANMHAVIMDLKENPTHNMILAKEREPFPLEFSVEFGAYVNVLRSALDLLACSIALRHGITKLDDVYFPVARDAANFFAGKYRAHKFLERLPASEKQRFESLKPYRGGDDDIFLLHHLDIERKHRRLLVVEPKMERFRSSTH